MSAVMLWPILKCDFTFINETRNALRTPGSGKLIDSISAVYGADAARQMIEITALSEGFKPALDDIRISGTGGITAVGAVHP